VAGRLGFKFFAGREFTNQVCGTFRGSIKVFVSEIEGEDSPNPSSDHWQKHTAA